MDPITVYTFIYIYILYIIFYTNIKLYNEWQLNYFMLPWSLVFCLPLT